MKVEGVVVYFSFKYKLMPSVHFRMNSARLVIFSCFHTHLDPHASRISVGPCMTPGSWSRNGASASLTWSIGKETTLHPHLIHVSRPLKTLSTCRMLANMLSFARGY